MANNKFTLMLEGSPYEIERRGDLMVVNGVEFTWAMKDGQPLIGGTPHPVKLAGGSA